MTVIVKKKQKQTDVTIKYTSSACRVRPTTDKFGDFHFYLLLNVETDHI